ncbi:ERF family protein [Brevibacillus porteri]|uniref:ERF family protein n=1 Tax=Brevibacillus porteri TaxID=2126350 RepID=UPI003D234D1F
MNKSESIKELASALAKFNGEVSRIAKDANNPFFKNKYATLDQIIDEVRPNLTSHGLSIIQIPCGEGEHITLKTVLMHESGEWIESEPLSMKPVKNDPQSIGSAITYARRYSLSAFLSLNTGEDDDGNAATHTKPPNRSSNQGANQGSKQSSSQTNNASGGSQKITDQQLKALQASISELEKLGAPREQIISLLKQNTDIGDFESTKDLTIAKASKAIEQVKVWIKAKGGSAQ